MVYNRKKSRTCFITALFVSITLILTAAPVGYFDAAAKVTEADVKNIESKLANIEDKLNDIEEGLNDTAWNLSKQIKEKSYIDNKLTLISSSIDYAADLADAYGNQIKAKEQEIADMEEKIEAKYKEFEDWLKMTWENGDISYIQMILSTESFSDFLTNTEQIANIIEYQNRLMKKSI